MPTEEERLYERATQGDAASFDQLLERYLPQLHAFVRVRLGVAVRARESSMDVVQSVCRRLLSAEEAFRFAGEDRFRAWLFTSALNMIREKHRFHHLAMRDVDRETPDASSEALETVARLLTPSKEAAGREQGALLAEALQALSEEHREVITLARIAGLPHRAVAEVLQRSEEAVRQLLGRALVRLARELRGRGVEFGEQL